MKSCTQLICEPMGSLAKIAVIDQFFVEERFGKIHQVFVDQLAMALLPGKSGKEEGTASLSFEELLSLGVEDYHEWVLGQTI